MSVSLGRPRLATLDELLSHELYKRLLAFREKAPPELREVRGPKELLNSTLAREIVEIYRTLFTGSFSKLDMASLEHADFLSSLLPCLSQESFPIIANLDEESQRKFGGVRFCAVMTSVWCFVELHSSGRSEYVDVLSTVSSRHREAFENLFFNAAQLLMREAWNEQLCESREFEAFDRVTVLEQRALLRFFIVCFQRIELPEVRRCCMALLSPHVWMHIPDELREATFFQANKVSKMLYHRAMENYKLRHAECRLELLMERGGDRKDPASSVTRLYDLVPTAENLESLNRSYRLVLSRDFVNSLLNQFVYILEDHLPFVPGEGTSKSDEEAGVMRLMYVENYLELFVDLLSQLHLRRIIKPMIESKLILVRCKNHPLYQTEARDAKYEGNIFVELINILEYYLNFNINEELGVSMDYNVILEAYYKRFNSFQRVCYLNYRNEENLKNVHLINNYALNASLVNILASLDLGVLVELNQKLHLIPRAPAESEGGESIGANPDYMWPYAVELIPKRKKHKKTVKKLLVSNLMAYLRKPLNELTLINKNNFYLNPFSSLFNTTTTLNPDFPDLSERAAERPEAADSRMDREEFVEIEEDVSYIKMSTLSLFKLNLQYLTLFDYLYRNFILYQFEIIYQIKQYIQQQVFILFSFPSNTFSKLGTPQEAEKKWVGRMFISIDAIAMRVANKRIRMTVTLDLSLIQDYKIRQEWQQLTKFDILYLIQLRPHYGRYSTGSKEDDELLWGKDVRRIRFGEILEVLDEDDNNVLDFNPLDKKSFSGFKMRVNLLLDYDQYMKDIQEDLDFYNCFNLVMRRSKRQNNFKSILTNVQNVLNHRIEIPNWLQVILLGYIHNAPSKRGSPADQETEALKRRRKEITPKVGVNYLNTFKSKQHLLNTTQFVPVKLIPVLRAVKNRSEHKGAGGRDQLEIDKEKLELKENWMYVDALDAFLNEFAYQNRSHPRKKEFVERLRSSLLANANVLTFIENYLSPEQDGLVPGDVDTPDRLVLHGVEFELYLDEGYLSGLTKLNNNYYLRENRVPRFLLTNFNQPFKVNLNRADPHLNNLGSESNAQNSQLNGHHLELNGIGGRVGAQSPDASLGLPNNAPKSGPTSVKFVRNQVESIVSGTLEGLTVIMGPPGTGKTDVVAQIISILFNNYEHEKIVICTHSNFALNDIFTKLAHNDLIDEHYMVRLGHSDLEVDQMGHFSKFGRVNYILQRRLDVLEVIRALKEQLEIVGDYEFTLQYSITFLQYYFLNALFKDYPPGHAGAKDADDLARDRRFMRALDEFFSADRTFPYTLKDIRKLYDQIQLSNRLSSATNKVPASKKGDDTGFDGGVDARADVNGHPENGRASGLGAVDADGVDSGGSETNPGAVELNGSEAPEGDLTDLKDPDYLARRSRYKSFIEKLFECVNELLPFEVLRNNRDRMKYLVENYSRIVAMTCTHASIAKEELATLNYKSLVFEEAAQILEIESFIPICSNIKRLVLCGDHLQLSPIIQNAALHKYSNLNQSLFLRLIRLNYPYVQLNVQARSRPEILAVYKNFYPNDIYTLNPAYLEGTSEQESEQFDGVEAATDGLPTFKLTVDLMAGLKAQLESGAVKMAPRYAAQLIDVKGEESSPIRHFYQNLQEANYCVHLYMLLRLLGLEDIVILTAYNGQKCLIEDVVKKKCSWNNRIGSPMVSTIDKYQGRQANYVIVSMVRTRNVGYLRDPRRFVVATSRSKLGLYVVGSKELIQNIKELAVFNAQLSRYPSDLRLELVQSLQGAGGRRVLELTSASELEDLVKALM